VNRAFLDAAWGASTATAPIWLMRQAGRYLPEYRELKERYTFWEMVRKPELAVEITLQPVRRFPLDAAILFSDIMTPLPAMGVKVEFAPGPVIENPVRTGADVDRLVVPDLDEIAPFVTEACALLRAESPVPLIGFAGAPLTLATYLIAGSGLGDHSEPRAWLWRHPEVAHALLDKLTEVTIRYLKSQIRAGAQAVQLFDSWAGEHSGPSYARFGLPYARRVLEALADSGAPRLYLAVGASHLYPRIAELPAEVVSVDWRTPLADCRRLMPGKTLQGNLDPAMLLGSPDVATSAAIDVLRDGLGGPHIFNLGHGVLRTTSPDTVARVIDAVHEFRRDVAPAVTNEEWSR
jgi:uroporphyrinogen decarboxylase